MAKRKSQIETLRVKIEYLIGEVMRKSAELSEAREELKELKNILDIYLDQESHNKCWVREVWLRHRLKKPDGSPYPNPEKVRLAEFLWGCKIFAPEQYPKLTPQEEQMMKELEQVLRKYLHNYA